MNTSEAHAFETELLGLLELYGKPAPTDAALALWWRTLEPFPWSVVSQALSAHAAECQFAPTPADLVGRIRALDGRPAPEEAWSLAIEAMDEAATVVWTGEMAEAWGVAAPILETGDKVGARQAFAATYARLVADARRALVPAAWRVSLGNDPERRTVALTRAVEQERLPRQQAAALLPPPRPDTDVAAVAGLLAGNVHPLPDLQARNARRFIATVRAALAGKEPPQIEDASESA
ncbi:hypothetical protein [Imhoffiella purpurea]|uniref:Replicative helicase inhibitor G39P N-terminal domain-containing protein n=1 Tax=Imhoffiella purpurea TaxID=1249627 RepID=W9VWD7_9GAMM|nr:hypothetical protein [Imhoffiella purpurea]EXJ14760.1 hypothetical protein D779_2129 [Imhoffiella purpurea]